MTVTLTAQNIGIDGIPQYAKQPTLWVRADHLVAPSFVDNEDHREFTLAEAGKYDFMTFFNALSVMKWRRYTNAKAFHLRLSVKAETAASVTGKQSADEAMTVTLTMADTYSFAPTPVQDVDPVAAPADGEWHDLSIAVPQGYVNKRNPVLFGATIETAVPVRIRDARWDMDANEEDVHDVEVALCITTFKKEPYIRRNARIFHDAVLGSGTDAGRHFTLHIVDNGRTLHDEEVLAGDRIKLHPNVNSGGAGGFARGMIESIEQTPKATHVILMDDDVSLSPESLLRTYSLLKVVKDEWREAFISGAMMSLDEPDIRPEDMGFFNKAGWCQPIKPVMRMSVLHDVIENEAYQLPEPRNLFEDQYTQRYQAWWYCCIPMTQIERRGMPLPLFVRYDDVEYSLRNPPKIMSMNGLCVWHSPFFMRYDAAVERYQVARNLFIIRHTSGCAPLSDFEDALFRQIQIELKRFNYDDAEVALEGFEDFLKGPDVTFAPGFAEKQFLGSHRRIEKLLPLEELDDELKKLGIDYRKLEMDDIVRDKPRTFLQRGLDFITFNGQRTPLPYTKAGKVAVCEANGGAYTGGELREAEIVVAISVPQRKGAIRYKNQQRFNELWKRYKKDVKEYHDRKDELDKLYHEAFARMTTVKAWKEYLGI